MSFSEPIFIILAIIAVGFTITAIYFAVGYRMKAARNALLCAIATIPLAAIIFITGVLLRSRDVMPV